MDSWAPVSGSLQLFASLFSVPQQPSPGDKSQHQQMQCPPSIHNQLFHLVQQMNLSQPDISLDHNLTWASTLLETCSPSPQPKYHIFCDLEQLNLHASEFKNNMHIF